MRSVDVAPLVEHRHDLVLLTGSEPVDRAPARHCVVEALTVSDAATPPLQATLGQLQAHARRPGAPPGRLGAHDQLGERRLRGRIHPARDPATAPQGPFPSASVNLTAISANAVRRRSTWAPAASGSTSRCLSRRPGRDRANAPSAPCRATSRSFATVDRSTRARSAASPTVVSPRTSCIQISYFSCGAKNRFLLTPDSILNTTPQDSAQNPPMLAETNRQQRHKVSRNTVGVDGVGVSVGCWAYGGARGPVGVDVPD